MDDNLDDDEIKEMFCLCRFMPELGGYSEVAKMPRHVRVVFIQELCKQMEKEDDAIRAHELFKESGGSGRTYEK